MFSFRKCQEPVRRETTEGSSIEFTGYLIPQHGQNGCTVLGGVYMTRGRLSPRSEFTLVPSHGSIFVYMISPQNVMPARLISVS